MVQLWSSEDWAVNSKMTVSACIESIDVICSVQSISIIKNQAHHILSENTPDLVVQLRSSENWAVYPKMNVTMINEL